MQAKNLRHPRLFGAGALTFGLSYFFVVVLHHGAFALKAEGATAKAILGIAPFNLGASALLIGAAFVYARWAWLLFLAASSLFVAVTVLRRERRFTLNAHHFAERHGLVILIVSGQSQGTTAIPRTRPPFPRTPTSVAAPVARLMV